MTSFFRRLSAIILGSILVLPAAFAQDNEPTTSWPYVYPDFTKGTIYMTGGLTITQKMNVHLGHSTLHYIDGQTIKEIMLKDVIAVEIGSEKYISYNASIFKVVASNEKGILLEQTTGNFAALAETGGAYGTSSASSATQNLSSIEGNNTVGCNHMILFQNKSDGQTLPLIVKYYIKTLDNFVPATKKELDKAFASRADEWKVWLKANKIKWNKSESLANILNFL